MMQYGFPYRIDGGVRRIITGVDAAGKGVVTADDRVTGDVRNLMLWGADAPPVTGDATAPKIAGWWPPPGGVRVSLSTRRPDRAPADAVHAQGWPDISDASGFHASNSTDIILVVSGTIWLELDDGVEVEMGAGDVLVQNGTRHRWRNHGDGWPIIAVVIVGATPAPPQNG